MKMRKNKFKKRMKIVFELFISSVIVFSVFYSRNIYGKLFLEKNLIDEQNNSTQNVNEAQNSNNQKEKLTDEQLTTEIKKVISKYETNSNKIGLVYNNLKTGYRYTQNEEEYFAMASTTKVIYAMYVYDRVALGQISADADIEYSEDQLESGNGEITNSSKKKSYKLDYVVMNMLTHSDNTATNMILGSKANTVQLLTKYFSNFSISMPESMLKDNKITPANMEKVWLHLYNNQDKYSKVIEYLKRSESNEWIKNGIKNKDIASKYGQITAVANDTAIVYGGDKGDYILLIYTNNLSDSSKTIADIANKINELHDNNS